jgi:quinol monooxygenase YgiN
MRATAPVGPAADPPRGEDKHMPGVVTISNSAFIARFPVRPDKREEFLAIFDALWRGSLEFMNAQCNLVFYGWDRDDEWFYTIESYKDETMLDQLRQSDMFQTTVQSLLACCSQSMELRLLRGMEMGGELFEKYPAGPSQVHPKAGEIGVVIS